MEKTGLMLLRITSVRSTCGHTRTHARTHARTPARTHAHTHARTHTYFKWPACVRCSHSNSSSTLVWMQINHCLVSLERVLNFHVEPDPDPNPYRTPQSASADQSLTGRHRFFLFFSLCFKCCLGTNVKYIFVHGALHKQCTTLTRLQGHGATALAQR